MNWNENIGNTSIDEAFNFNNYNRSPNIKKRSSILKPTKKANFDNFETERRDEETENFKYRQSSKRVSFAETFQVKELNTGNIYDIPGWNESTQSSVQISQVDIVANNPEGTFPPRSFVPDASSTTYQDPIVYSSYKKQGLRNGNLLNQIEIFKDPTTQLIVTKNPSLEFPSMKITQAPALDSQAVMNLLEGKCMSEDKENVHPKKEMPNLHVRKSLKSEMADDFDFLGKCWPKSCSQESKENLAVKASSTTKNHASEHLKVDSSNKENLLQTSPKFARLKFIDSPPSWKSGQNDLKCQNKGSEGKENVVASLQPSYNNSSEDKENMYCSIVPKASTVKQSGTQIRKVDLNCTKYDATAMDITMLVDPDAMDLESDISVSIEDLPLSGFAGYEKTQNKTRFSTVDMEMTCVFPKTGTESLLPGSSGKEQLSFVDEPNLDVDKENCNVMVCGSEESLKSSQQSNADFSFLEVEQNPLLISSNSLSSALADGGNKASSEKEQLSFVDEPNLDVDKENYDVMVCGSGESPKSSQQSNADFSFLEMEQDPLLISSNSLSTALADVGNKPQYLANSIFNQDINHSLAINHSLKENIESIKYPLNMVRTKQNSLTCNAKNDASGRKFLKFLAEPESSPSKLQTLSSPAGKTGSSFMLKNKENLPSNRKRCLQSSNKQTFGVQRDVLGSDLKIGTDLNCLPQRLRSGNDLAEKDNREIPNGSSFCMPPNKQIQHSYRSEIMEMTCHNLSLNESGNEISSPIVKEIRILTETKISSPDAVFTSKKYETTRYSVHNMDLTCLQGSENASEITGNLESEMKLTGHANVIPDSSLNISLNNEHLPTEKCTSVSNLKYDPNTQYFTSQAMDLTCYNTNFNDDGISVPDSKSKPGELYPDHLNDKACAKYENKTQHFISQPMELTCNVKSNNVPDMTLRSGWTPNKKHLSPPYFHLKGRPIGDSKDKNISDSSFRSGQRMFKVIGSDFSSSKLNSSSRHAVSANNSNISESYIAASNNQSLKSTAIKNFSNVEANSSKTDSFFKINKAGQNFSNDQVMPCFKPEEEDLGFVDAEKRAKPQPTRTPGVVYKIKRIKQFKEKSGDVILYPDLSEALKRNRKFNLRHPYTEMRISSPGAKNLRLNHSFDPSSQENSFICASRDQSGRSSLRKLSSGNQLATELSVMAVNGDSSKQKLQNVNVVVDSPEKQKNASTLSIHPSIMSMIEKTNCNLDYSEILPVKQCLSESRVQTSMLSPERPQVLEACQPEAIPMNQTNPNMLKDDYSMMSPEKMRIDNSVSCTQASSVTFNDDSLQLLSDSALENSYLEAASKNFTICFDKSDYVLKEKAKPPKLSVLNMDENDCVFGNEMICNPIPDMALASSEKSVRNDANASIVEQVSCRKSLVSLETFKNTSTNQSHLEISIPRQALSSKLCSADIEDLTIEDLEAMLEENLRMFPVESFCGKNSSKNYKSDTPKKIDSDEVLSNLISDSQSPKQDKNNAVVMECATKSEDVSSVSKSFDVGEDSNIAFGADCVVSGIGSTPIANVKITTAAKDSVTVIEDQDEMQMESSIERLGNESSSCNLLHHNKEVTKSNLEETEDSRLKKYGVNLQDCRDQVLKHELCCFIETFEKEIANKWPNWELKKLSGDGATFELAWAVFVYRCALRVEVTHTSASESSVTFTPCGWYVGGHEDGIFGDIQERGYKFFDFLVKDTVLPFHIFSEEMFEKLHEYVRIAKDVEALMRDLLKVSVAGVSHNPPGIDPVCVTVATANTNYECSYDMSFRVDVRNYPREKIVPELKHKHLRDITKEIAIACSKVQPGKDYLYRMVNAARELRP